MILLIAHSTKKMAKILLVEDNQEQALMISEYLCADHHQVEVIVDGQQGLDRVLLCAYDLIILDWELPGVAGVDICKQYRQSNGLTPIIMLTAKGLVSNKLQGLDAGADDYLPKPFSIRELGARVRALLRRSSGSASNVLEVNDITLDPQKFLVIKNGQQIDLVGREFNLLEFFMRHPDEVFTADALLQRVWQSGSDAGPEALRTCLFRLRKKLGGDESSGDIVTVHGVGYKLKTR
jgi:two-component system OmpR family response regulator